MLCIHVHASTCASLHTYAHVHTHRMCAFILACVHAHTQNTCASIHAFEHTEHVCIENTYRTRVPRACAQTKHVSFYTRMRTHTEHVCLYTRMHMCPLKFKVQSCMSGHNYVYQFLQELSSKNGEEKDQEDNTCIYTCTCRCVKDFV